MTGQKLDAEVVLTVSEAAQLARVSQDTIRRQIALGQLRAKRIGRCTRVVRAEFDRWISDDRLAP